MRNPRSVRPWQHVLEPLSGYLRLAARQLPTPARFAEAWNFGPRPGGALGAGAVAELAADAWGAGRWTSPPPDPAAPHEAGCLELDSAKAVSRLGWRPGLRRRGGRSPDDGLVPRGGRPGFDAAAFSRGQIAEYAEAARRAAAAWAAR